MKKAVLAVLVGFVEFLIVLILGFAIPSFAVSMNFTGNFRAETEFLNKPDLGLLPQSPNKAFIAGRGLLNPNLIIDDHFSVKTQWLLLTSNGMGTANSIATPGASGLGAGQGSWVFGDNNTVALYATRAWLEWTSDFGVFRIGRMPFSWGYGLIYDAGNNVWDDWQTTFDRLEYRLHLGHVIGALAYSKPQKNNVQGDAADSTFYTVYLQYDNPELDVEGGILYENQWRGGVYPNPYAVGFPPSQVPNAQGVGINPNQSGQTPPLAQFFPSPRVNHMLDVYLKKTVGYFSFGGEGGWLTGKARDYNGDGQDDSLNSFGFTVNVTYNYHALKVFTDLLYASGDASLLGGHLNGFTVLNRNRRPGLILGRELLGPYAGNNINLGGCALYGNANSFSGCFYVRPGIRLEWSQAWASGVEVIVARKAATQAGESANLGIELDLGTDYAVYQNFDLGVNMGVLFAGAGLQVPNPDNVVALRATAAVRF